MKQSTFSTLLAVIIATFSAQVTSQSTMCDYQYTSFSSSGSKSTNQTYYACYLNTTTLHNVGAEVSSIQGQHTFGQSDATVKYLIIQNGNNLVKFSSIFCNKFRNLEAIYVIDATIEVLDVNSLSNCGNLQYLYIRSTDARELPANLLIGKVKLIKLHITNNKLTVLPEKLFINQKELKELSLSENQINSLPGNIFHPLVKLELLFLDSNKIQTINPDWFVNLQNLRELRLDGNQLTQIPSKSFASLTNLKKLWLYDNSIKSINSDNFDGLQNLQFLALYNNELSDLPAGVFAQLRGLQDLSAGKNKLTIIHSDSFSIPNQLTSISLSNNQINAIDPKLIENTTVAAISMKNNICSHVEVRRKSEIMSSLKKCFNNYQPRKETQIIGQKSGLSSSSPQKKIICGQQVTGNNNITAGKPVYQRDFPWNAALLRNSGEFLCGGSLVTNRKVVTAARCIHNKEVNQQVMPNDAVVLLGTFNYNAPLDAGSATFSIQSIIIHPDWNPQAKSYDADIAVLVLHNEVTFSPTIQPICLPRLKNNIEEITSGYFIGYDRSDFVRIFGNIPKYIEVPINNNKKCFHKHPELQIITSQRTFCGGTGTGVDICKGELGNGLIVKSGSAYYLRGVALSSLNNPNGQCDSYAMFTDVSKFVDWIFRISASQ